MTYHGTEGGVDWKGPSFKTLAEQDPKRLLAIITNGTLAEHDLTFAAEALGLINNPPLEILCELANNPSPIVREGAVYGLAKHRHSRLVETALRRRAEQDPSPGVRESASEALEP